MVRVPLPQPLVETVEPHPSRGYGKAKWLAEQAVWAGHAEGLPAVVLRPVSVFGPGAIPDVKGGGQYDLSAPLSKCRPDGPAASRSRRRHLPRGFRPSRPPEARSTFRASWIPR